MTRSVALPPLWLCADATELSATELLERVAAVVHGMRACIWLRSSEAIETRGLRRLAGDLARVAHDAGCPLVIGDRIDLALAVGADAVHLRARSVRPRDALRLLRARGSDAWLTAAVHDEASVRDAGVDVDVLVLSPFGAVADKGPPLGVGGFARLVALCPGRAFVALGGITTPQDAADAARAGASAIAVRRALTRASDPVEACASLHAAFTFTRARAGRDDAVPSAGANTPPAPSARWTLRPPA